MKTSKTAAIICFEDAESAVGRFAASAARGLAADGHTVLLLSRQALNVSAENVTTHVIKSESEGDLIGDIRAFTLGVYGAFTGLVPHTQDDIVLVGCEWSAIPALQIISALRAAPILLCFQTLERQRSDMTSRESKQIEEFEIQGIRQAKSVLVRGEKTAELAIKIAGLDSTAAKRVEVLADSFPVESFRRALDVGAVKARHMIGPVDPTFLFVGPLDEDHGPDLLMKAIPIILKAHGQARFIFVGEGPLFWMLRIYTRYLNLEHAVRILGHLEGAALNEIVQAADIIIAPERKTGDNWPILAGWAAGKAVVASHEAAQGLITHEQNGVLIYPLADSCAWGACQILKDTELWSRLVENGKEKISVDMGEKALAAQLQKVMATI